MITNGTSETTNIIEIKFRMPIAKKRIVLDCDLMRYPHSGLYHYCLNLGKEVSNLLQNDEQLEMMMYLPPAEKVTLGSGIKSIIEKRSYWNFLNPIEKKCSVWHAPFQSGRILPAKKRNPSLKILLTIHDLNPLHEGKSIVEQQKSLAHTRQLIEQADALVCISHFTKADVLKNFEIDDKPVSVIYNGVHAIGKAALDTNSYYPEKPFLFGMGYVNRKKNYHVLLPLLENEDLEMIIAGRLDEPDYVDMIRQKALAMGVQDRLRLTGPISENEKAWYYENCLAFLHPSLAEGFGAPVVEVMQFGKPVFLSSLTSLPEIGGDAAFYFESFEREHMQHIFFNGMQKFSENGMSERVKQRAAFFNWKQQAKEYLAVYKQLAAGLNT